MQYPEGYLDSLANKEKEKENKKKDEDPEPTPSKRKRKSNSDDRVSSTQSPKSTPKKSKVEAFKLTAEQKKLIKDDEVNKKVWDEALLSLKDGPKFLSKLEETFLCICCQEVVFQPITTECQHNVCKSCLQRSFKADVYTCPACRYDIGKNCSMVVNKCLQSLLTQLFPGYGNGR